MKFAFAFALLALSTSLIVTAAPASELRDVPTSNGVDVAHLPTTDKREAPRFSCGQYKYKDGTVQEFYSQVWAGLPADIMICRNFKYEFGDKKGQEGTMAAAKVDSGCTCYFYETPCDPGRGYTETWEGWLGWENYAGTDKSFKGWKCYEHN